MWGRFLCLRLNSQNFWEKFCNSVDLCLFFHMLISIPRSHLGFPWWFSVWESTCQRRVYGFHADAGRSHMLRGSKAHVPQLLNLSTAATEALVLRADGPQQEKSPWEAQALRWKVAPFTTTGENLCAARKTRHSRK